MRAEGAGLLQSVFSIITKNLYTLYLSVNLLSFSSRVSDDETYMSADDLRINLWNLEITNQSFNIVDIKPANMEDLTEVITAAEFHPQVF